VRRTLLAALAAASVLTALTACDSGPSAPGESKVAVDTPQLRQLKARTGIEDCAPGRGADGGLPAITLPCLGGGPAVDLSSLKGPMIVNLWASNCGPCREEMPALQDFYQRYGDRVAVVGIDYQDTQPAAALELARRSKVTYPLLADPGGDVNAHAPIPVIRGIPFFLFVKPDGTVSAAAGGIDSADALVELAGDHLGIHL
jgi:thiol-disulfide isomerase/thioredoxin